MKRTLRRNPSIVLMHTSGGTNLGEEGRETPGDGEDVRDAPRLQPFPVPGGLERPDVEAPPHARASGRARLHQEIKQETIIIEIPQILN